MSAMLHFPHDDKAFEADGAPAADQDAARWAKYAYRGIEQLHWWAEAAARQRPAVDPFGASPAFRRTPSNRDAP